MATDTLQEYEALLESGFKEEQARALIQLVSPSRPDPEVLTRLDRIEQSLGTQSHVLEQQSQVLERHSRLLEQHSQVLHAMLPLVQRIPAMEDDISKMKEDIGDLRSGQFVIEERVKMEGRVSRMINATLIALGAIAASLAAAFAR